MTKLVILTNTDTSEVVTDYNSHYCAKSSHSSTYQYKFGGKEYQPELGLEAYDFGARNYMPDLGRWSNIDPFTELMRKQSPFNYGFNNPVYFSDYAGTIPWPVPEMFKKWTRKIDSWFGLREGRNHNGIDFNFSGGGNTDKGAPVVATHMGKVIMIKSTTTGRAGRYIEIESPDGSFKTRYLHLSSIVVTPGQEISEGQTIGLLGGSGFGKELGYTAHLHYEIHKRDKNGNYTPYNPTQNRGNNASNLVDPQTWVVAGPWPESYYNNMSRFTNIFDYYSSDSSSGNSSSSNSSSSGTTSRSTVAPVNTISPEPYIPQPSPDPGPAPVLPNPPAPGPPDTEFYIPPNVPKY